MNTLITLDYELFFGDKSGTVDNCILKPTDKLLAVLDKHNIKGTFYVDVGYLSRSDELGYDQESTELVKKQLQFLTKQGHDMDVSTREQSLHDLVSEIGHRHRQKLEIKC